MQKKIEKKRLELLLHYINAIEYSIVWLNYKYN